MSMGPDTFLTLMCWTMQENFKKHVESVEFVAEPLSTPLTAVEKSFLGLRRSKTEGSGRVSETLFEDRKGRPVYVARRLPRAADGKEKVYLAAADYRDDYSITFQASLLLMFTATGAGASSRFELEPSVTLGQPTLPHPPTGRMDWKGDISALGHSGHHYLVPLLKYGGATATTKKTQDAEAGPTSPIVNQGAHSTQAEGTFGGTVEVYAWLLPTQAKSDSR